MTKQMGIITSINTLLSKMYPIGTVLWFKNSTPELSELPGVWEIYTDLVGRYPLGTDNSENDVGETVEESLPNITGTIAIQYVGKMTGAFSNPNPPISDGSGGAFETNYGSVNQRNFNAHDSNPVYQNDAPVQPKSVKLIPYVRVS